MVGTRKMFNQVPKSRTMEGKEENGEERKCENYRGVCVRHS